MGFLLFLGYQIFVPFKAEKESRGLLISPCLLAEQQNIKLLFSVEINGLSRCMEHHVCAVLGELVWIALQPCHAP